MKSQNAQDPKQDALIRGVFDAIKQGKIDRSLFTNNANSYFNEQALKDYSASSSPLGDPQTFAQTSMSHRGGMTHHSYQVKYPQKSLRINIYEMPDGKFEQYLISATE